MAHLRVSDVATAVPLVSSAQVFRSPSAIESDEAWFA
jgi:hypothetical protein